MKWVFASAIVINVIIGVTTVILARLLLPSNFGLIAIGLVVINTLRLLCEAPSQPLRRKSMDYSPNTVYYLIYLALSWCC